MEKKDMAWYLRGAQQVSEKEEYADCRVRGMQQYREEEVVFDSFIEERNRSYTPGQEVHAVVFIPCSEAGLWCDDCDEKDGCPLFGGE